MKKLLFFTPVFILTNFIMLPVLAYAIENNPVNIPPISTPPLSPIIPTQIHPEQLSKLAQSITWQRLLYYPENITVGSKKSKSRVASPSFFVSPNGATDPEQELQAMITALFSQNMSNTLPEQAVQCRFPARTHWLKQQLGITDTQLPAISCPQLDSWLRQIDPDSASIIFAEEYLDNPTSAFGHSFLRLDNATTHQAHILNYMPKSFPNESFVKSSYKSLLAGNTGEFTIEPYEQKIQQYRDKEGRDIWRYDLKLTQSELQQLARQIWEIKDQNLTYYLTTDNCASEILVLLNTLRPEKNYLEKLHLIVSPADLVRELQRQGVLGKASYQPSIETQQQAKLNANLSSPIPTPSNRQSTTIILADNNPQDAHPLGRTSLGVGQQTHHYNNSANTATSEQQNFAELGYRLVYHDALDPRSGYPLGYALEALSVKLRAYQDKNQHVFANDAVELQNFTVIKARSLNPVNTTEQGKSWGGHLQLLQQSDTGKDHLVGSIGAEYGWSVAYGTPKLGSGEIPPNLCYALGTGTAQVGKGLQKGYRAGLGATLGCIAQFSPKLRGTAELALPFWYQANRQGDDGYWQPMASLGLQYDINNNNAIRLTDSYTWQPKQPMVYTSKQSTPKLAKLKNTNEFSLQYLYYF